MLKPDSAMHSNYQQVVTESIEWGEEEYKKKKQQKKEKDKPKEKENDI